jgi:hypothetical protein
LHLDSNASKVTVATTHLTPGGSDSHASNVAVAEIAAPPTRLR